jgi:hypothetical protein
MNRGRLRWRAFLLLLGGLCLGAGCMGTMCEYLDDDCPCECIEVYRSQKPDDVADELADDNLDDRRRPAFDAARVDRRPLGGGRVNASAAVLRLDIVPRTVESKKGTETLYPSYAEAVASASPSDLVVLPSVNLLDGLGKQFDDGLYAALDLAYYRGLQGRLTGHVELIRRMYALANPASKEAAYLAAGLELAGVQVPATDTATRQSWLSRFRSNEVWSKPIGFYTWSPELEKCFRFLRFFQYEFRESEQDVPRALAALLARDGTVEADYRKAVEFYARLSNHPVCRSLLDLEGPAAHATVAVFPSSSSRESLLFEKLFPNGLPADANLMQALIRRIRSGEVDLRPRPESGWYEHQVYALETMLLPTKGEEHDKLLLTKAYKKRMVEAFEALLTKRRETHAREMSVPIGCGATAAPVYVPERKVSPRLRVEPCPTFYLRTARAYAFLGNFLEASVGREALCTLHGLRQQGPREADLDTELHAMCDRFYGLYLVSAEDLGLKPAFAEGEAVDEERCYQLAVDWLAALDRERDLAADTRVIVPVYADAVRGRTRAWATLGVRLAKLTARYEVPPSLQGTPDGPWTSVPAHQLEDARYLIAVDEFAEVELKGMHVLSREEFRALCNKHKTRQAILAALR